MPEPASRYDVTAPQRELVRYDREAVLLILERVAGGELLAAVCASDPRLPTAANVRRWASTDVDGIAAVYRDAHELQAHAWSDELVRIADHGEDLERDKLRVSVRERLMRVRAASTYAPPKQVSLAGGVDWLSVLRAAGCAPPLPGRAIREGIEDATYAVTPDHPAGDLDGSLPADPGDTGERTLDADGGGGSPPLSPSISEFPITDPL